MNWIIWVVLGIMFLALAGLLISILYTQKTLDIPCSGLLLVDHQDTDGPALVYFQAAVDPKTYKDGETIKLRVKIIKPDSQ